MCLAYLSRVQFATMYEVLRKCILGQYLLRTRYERAPVPFRHLCVSHQLYHVETGAGPPRQMTICARRLVE